MPGISAIGQLAIAEFPGTVVSGAQPQPTVHGPVNGFSPDGRGGLVFYYADTTTVLPAFLPNNEFPNSGL